MPRPDSNPKPAPKENPMPPTLLEDVKHTLERLICLQLGANYVLHWRTLLSLWEQHPKRTALDGWMEWTLDAHMDAMKIPKRQRQKRAEEIYDAINRLLRMEAVTACGGRWESAPLMAVVGSAGRDGERFDRMTWMPILVQRAEALDALDAPLAGSPSGPPPW